uniref:Tetratricopeptide repeat protein n=2 Tax=Ciona intestinalis TaxID=7719 RepID=F7AQ96_CIOIN
MDINFDIAMSEADRQVLNPRCDSANHLDKLAYFYMNCKDVSKAIKCFEYSFIMRKQIYGTYSKYDEIVEQSLMQLGAAYCKNNQHDKALTASGLSLAIARNMKSSKLEAISWHNAGHCWEKLKDYHVALNCYESREATLRKSAETIPVD